MNVIDVIKALTELLNAKYPTSKISNKDIKSPERPCGFIKLISTKRQRISEGYTQTIISLDVIYFAETQYKGYLELVKKQTELELELDKPLKVGDVYVDINELEFNMNEEDYILNTMFDVTITEETEIESAEDKEATENSPDNAGYIYDIEHLITEGETEDEST